MQVTKFLPSFLAEFFTLKLFDHIFIGNNLQKQIFIRTFQALTTFLNDNLLERSTFCSFVRSSFHPYTRHVFARGLKVKAAHQDTV